MASNVLLKAVGLNTQHNQLDLPPGSLIAASNVIIRRDNVIEPRRGYKLYGEPFGSSSDRAKQLFNYKNRILFHYSDKIEFDTGTQDSGGQEIFNAFAGSYLEPQTGRRIRSIEANSNFYFTTSNGIQKISAKTAADFTTAANFIQPAGGIKALDLTAKLAVTNGEETGFLPQDSTVAYRVVWGYNDANNNLILGTPSQRAIVFNPLSDLLLRDYNNLLGQLDNVSNGTPASLIDDGDYVATLGLPINSPATLLQSNLIALTTKIDEDILYADQVSVAPLQISGASVTGSIGTVSFSSGDPSLYWTSGSNINLTNFTPLSGIIDGAQIISTLVPTFSTTGTTTPGTQQVTSVTTVPDVTASLAGSYWLINSADNATQYYVWYQVSGVGTDPLLNGKTGIQVNIATNDTDSVVASDTENAILGITNDFAISIATNTLTITNNSVGLSDDALAGNSGFTVTTSTAGVDGNVITTIADASGINVGVIVTGTGIPANTFVVSVGIGTITISNNATTSGPGTTLSFQAAINFNLTTTIVGPINILNGTIYSNSYEVITQPSIPSPTPTDSQLVELQTYLQAIINQLQSEPSTVISSASQSAFITPISLTTSANVTLTFTIPQNVTANDFYQIYRSNTSIATGVTNLNDLTPDDEMQLVFEGFPTTAQLAAGNITVTDTTPDAFKGAFLYTNETTGQGILQSNDLPPFALDINVFKNVVFYANTRTRHSETINLLGVSNMIADFNNGITPTITISDGTTTNTYTFITGITQIETVTTVADVAGNLAGKSFLLNSANNTDLYYVWYTVAGVGTDPAITGRTGILVPLDTNDSADVVAQKTTNILLIYNYDFEVSLASNVITISMTEDGFTTGGADVNSGFAFAVLVSGRGENAAANQVLLSTVISPSQAVDNTARSLVHVINSNANEIVYAYYLSGSSQVPGQIQLQARSLSPSPFYIIANDDNTGSSFNPDLSPNNTITNISAANPTIITSTTPHGLTNGDKVIITNSNSTPSINGAYVITFIDTTHFSINVHVTATGNQGSFSNVKDAVTSDNEQLQNRIYYSKLLQPDAVPIVNTIDVGAKDKAILRIFPLRDSLFVYKEDGLFRISGETAPFNLALFDISCVLIAPDSLDVCNNLIYGWTRQGIYSTSESGTVNVSRPIDVDILPLATSQYTNFITATWGVGYESDNSYTVYTVQSVNDTVAQIGFRYSTLTSSWTTFDKTANCGVINFIDDTQYLGAGDTDFLEQERKNFDRTDYADRELAVNLDSGNYFGNQLLLPGTPGLAAGDVITQVQYVTIYKFNQLLKKLDTDVLLSPHNYFTTLQVVAGENMRTEVDALLNKIANDPGRISQAGAFPTTSYTQYESIETQQTITAISAGDPSVITSVAHGLTNGRSITIINSNSTPVVDGVFQVAVIDADHFTIPASVIVTGTHATFTVNNNNFLDIQSSYNGMIFQLNEDPGLSYKNYTAIVNSTLQEALIVAVNKQNKRVTLNNTLDFVQGPLTIYKAYDALVTWGPQTMGDALSFKQFREATIMFENRAFSTATLSFATDLLPAFADIPFAGTTNGIFGYGGIPAMQNGVPGPTGFGYGLFGGISDSAPFRTYIPRNAQRCRYLTAKFQHSAAREKFSIFGLSLTGEIFSTRAFR